MLLFYFVVLLRGMGQILWLSIKALIDEIRHPVVHHFYLNLLQDKVSLFFALGLCLLLETDLRSIHLNFSNLVLVIL